MVSVKYNNVDFILSPMVQLLHSQHQAFPVEPQFFPHYKETSVCLSVQGSELISWATPYLPLLLHLENGDTLIDNRHQLSGF